MIKPRTGLFGSFKAVLHLALALLLPLALTPALADVQDIAAASRSVVRVALVATDGQNAYFVGHGSGVMIAPGRVLTNAHVVELARSESNIVIGIIPSEGTNSYGGRILAYSPGNDLALLAVDDAPSIPIATFLAGPVEDGTRVTAIGYPGSVDRAQGMSIEDIIRPMSAVRTSGNVSAGRASRQFDTVLHTAPLAAGNSGGPLVDDCGRVIGINSFGSLSDGSDAEYGFAVSTREIASFLRQANVQVRRSSETCRSMAEIDAAQQAADERARAEAARRQNEAALKDRERAIAAREQAQQQVIARRENMIAIAALLLAAAALTGGAAVLGQSRGNIRHARRFGGAAGVLLLAAVLTFALRPSFDSAGAPTEPLPDAGNAVGNETDGAASAESGRWLCRLEPGLSRVTVSETADLSFTWTQQGCLDGRTQFQNGATGWSRALVPADEAAVSVRRFDPGIGRYRTDNYLVSAQSAAEMRALRDKIGWSSCSSDPERLAKLMQIQGEIEARLPSSPNERLVYHCERQVPETAGPGTAP
ncbi:S1C family serine protease [Sphingobium sp. B11D3A]|uniref:S1C family serine protease n=1 Tax=Sphingobium sp. B11D3A TaxID=2940574 RepID=UPI002224F425|nr:serine protease [Sphingobium sp. B11D3A]MCW2392322.1 S1-C subfamily serine protease [Sphingobium sp. B11D3A]